MNGLRFTGSLLLFVLALIRTPSTVHSSPDTANQTGVLVVAHGGSNRWNDMVRDAIRQAKLPYPVELALGMGMHPSEVRAFQQAIDRLERKGVMRILVVPLLVSSHSEVFRQFEYLFGLRAKATWPEAGGPLEHRAKIVMGRALDDDPIVAEILLERARSLSRQPSEEIVVLIAHGPDGQIDNQQWLATMHRLAQHIQDDGKFQQVLGLTMRDDAPQAVHDQATAELRQTVRHASQQARVLVVPLLIAEGGVERKIPQLLAGLTYVYKRQALLPHPSVSQWLLEQVKQLTQGAPGQVRGELLSAVVQ